MSEILALRWSRIDFARQIMLVKVKAVNGRVSRVKTECSEDVLPLDPDFACVLRDWKTKCHTRIGDWDFPARSPTGAITPVQFSRVTSGRQQRSSDWMVWDGILSATPTGPGSMPSGLPPECSRS